MKVSKEAVWFVANTVMAILASYAIIRFVAEPLVNRAKTALPPNKPLETAK